MESRPPRINTLHYKRKWLDVPYAHQSPTQKLDIYLPEQGEGPFPVILAVHGGAFMFGDKGDIMNEPMLAGLKVGFAVASINYRLSGEALFPAQIFDCKAAIRYLRFNASHYKLDPAFIGAWGPSAGGHLVSLLGTSMGVKELEDLSMGSPEASSTVQAVVDWCGPSEDFLRMDEELLESGFMDAATHSRADSPESLLLGAKITGVPERVKFASPMTYITPDVPPFLIQHGAQDMVVPVQQSLRLAEALAATAGSHKVCLEVLEGVGHHGDPAFETEENLRRVIDFLQQVRISNQPQE